MSPQLVFKQPTTTFSATDSSTASSTDDACPNTVGTSRKDARGLMIKTFKNRSRKRRPLVSFGGVTIREYERSIGDWWDIQYSLGLGWDYVERVAFPLPADEEDHREPRLKLEKLIARMLLLKCKPLKSKGTIGADSSSKVQHLGAKVKHLKSDDDGRLTSQQRVEMLINYGSSREELNQSEKERKILRVEYLNWKRDRKNSSPLFSSRCLADIEAILTDPMLTATAGDDDVLFH
mmetsp:Transcript_18340/g.42278  ORF Transcript_18340/g.42278 Transcript_18340/m.42278 type:complete len:235 (-) Transcript_18340:173-877(-)|eukprot:CAMPEP_0197187494 /NCGR_PEP_ID=MMETSP1423-20130617/15950_1 /TAXON_ID=476441 /ORGANISM="Pseudo-nitzschia heimii, Strain UNC1101" /LENGTH=234 /DNA_ID=CAMNT_0042639075 /DNA_START=44 /DNA_END=748 /DNA_ORIENTATION=+